jgi:hypothetical protein
MKAQEERVWCIMSFSLAALMYYDFLLDRRAPDGSWKKKMQAWEMKMEKRARLEAGETGDARAKRSARRVRKAALLNAREARHQEFRRAKSHKFWRSSAADVEESLYYARAYVVDVDRMRHYHQRAVDTGEHICDCTWYPTEALVGDGLKRIVTLVWRQGKCARQLAKYSTPLPNPSDGEGSDDTVSAESDSE